MPKSNDVEKSGLSLGQISKIQMEKIEQLTLYIIQQDKTIKLLQKEIELLKNQPNSSK